MAEKTILHVQGLRFCFFCQKKYQKVRIVFCCKRRNDSGDHPLSVYGHINFFHSPKFFKHKSCFRARVK